MAMRPSETWFELPVDAVHVWYVLADRVTDPAVLSQYDRFMSDDERKRRDRFVFAKDRHAFVVARGLVRSVLSRYARVAPDACVFSFNQYGKPSLRSAPTEAALEFNISHTHGVAAIAVTVGREIGIDVEDVTRTTIEVDVFQTFSPSEITALQAIPEAERPCRFFDYWTLKEAYIKARGMGLSLPLDGFSMHVSGSEATIQFASVIPDDPSTWQFVLSNPTPSHRMALAIRRRGADLPVRIKALDVNLATL
jgi:4'-phosphopantetheinyl transferase